MAAVMTAIGWLVLFVLVSSVTICIADFPKYPAPKGASARFKALVWAACPAANALIFFILHMMFYNRWDLVRTVELIAEKQLSYQRMGFLFWIVLIWTAAAALIGCSVRAFLKTKMQPDDMYLPSSVRSRKTAALIFDFSLIGLLLIGWGFFCADGIRHVKVNEICGKNISTAASSGYIEFRNESPFPCQIEHTFLSDSRKDLKKVEIPDCTVAAGQLVMVPIDMSALSVSKSGGSVLYFSDRGGSVIDTVVFDKQRKDDCSYSWSTLYQEWRYMLPSPGDVNLDVDAKTEKPHFSSPAGYYPDAFDVEILAGEDVEIHYTTDGCRATADSPLYTGAVRVTDRSSQPNRWHSLQKIVYDWKDYTPDNEPVKKAFVIRAVAVDSNGMVSDEAVVTYFVGQQFETDRAVISLTADENELFGEEGIYMTGQTYDNWYLNGGTGDRPTANFDQRGPDWERPVNIEFFKNGESLYFQQSGGLRVQGGSTRWLPFKRFSVFSRKVYSGSSAFEQEIFQGKATHSVVLRDGFCNAFSMFLIPDRDVSVQLSFPVTVYLNSEYWYDTYMQEKYNDTYFRQTYGVRNVEFLKVGITDEIKGFLENHDLSEQSNYEAFGRMVDIQSYIDYICTNVYLANTDYSEYGNTAMWRTTEKENDSYGDGRWRWCLYDMDLQTAGCRQNYGMTDITDAQVDSFNIVCDWDPPVNERVIYCALKANPDFRKQFVLSFMDMINTDFTEQRMTELLEQWGEDISYDEYFFRDRPKNMETFIAKEFDLKGTLKEVTVEINDEEAGVITVNTTHPTFTDGSWTGRYFTEYPVTVTAEAKPGYRFVGWEGTYNGSEASVELSVNGGVSIRAIFEKTE